MCSAWCNCNTHKMLLFGDDDMMILRDLHLYFSRPFYRPWNLFVRLCCNCAYFVCYASKLHSLKPSLWVLHEGENAFNHFDNQRKADWSSIIYLQIHEIRAFILNFGTKKVRKLVYRLATLLIINGGDVCGLITC